MAQTTWTLGSDSLSQTLTGEDFIDEAHINELRTAVNGLETLLDPDNQTLTLVQSSTTGETIDISRNLAATSTDSPIALFSQLNAGDDQPTLQIVETANANETLAYQRLSFNFRSDIGDGTSRNLVGINALGNIVFRLNVLANPTLHNIERQGIEFQKSATTQAEDNGAYGNINWFLTTDPMTVDYPVPDVVITAHAYDEDGDAHKHFTIYSSNAAQNATIKRFQLYFDQDKSEMTTYTLDWNMVNMSDYTVTGATTSNVYFRLTDASPSTDGVIFSIDPQADGSTGYTQLRIFRDTNTSNYVHFTIFKGDGTATSNARLAGQGADSYIALDNGNLGLATNTYGTNADGVFGVGNARVVPASSPAGMIQLYAKDSSDGATNSTLALRTEQAVESIGTFTPSHKIKVWLNEVEYHIQLDAV